MVRERSGVIADCGVKVFAGHDGVQQKVLARGQKPLRGQSQWISTLSPCSEAGIFSEKFDSAAAGEVPSIEGGCSSAKAVKHLYFRGRGVLGQNSPSVLKEFSLRGCCGGSVPPPPPGDLQVVDPPTKLSITVLPWPVLGRFQEKQTIFFRC